MSNSVHIPDSIKEIKESIASRITILAEWQTLLAKGRKPELQSYRQMQVRATELQIAELREALELAIEREATERAVAFCRQLEPVRHQWEQGLFD